ncbi:arylsulfatase [Tunturiibacter gelidoferens]|uniref:Arylsulfatase n=1 Tax=Tunturiibacter gelidiferens TaxID=3069689 RepID=A0A9X0QI41_9BACT|nr:arylsulfatase [Edaphobacter lichenicola]MBB5330679.1 arylsulfatase [Edaphobacter lichenicola]
MFNKKPFGLLLAGITFFATSAPAQVVTGQLGSPNATTTIEGHQLPAPPQKFGGVIKPSATDSKQWWAPRVVPPKGAPNVLLIMTDDQGYGVSGTFGGIIPTPALDRIANNGLRYTQFNSTALCSPTRAALITGRNHHSVGSGVIGELSTGYPGYNSVIGLDNASIGTILRDNGYSTSWFGKNHNTPTFQYSVAGPYDQWPSGLGFEYFYGFMGGETDQWTPYLFRDHTQITPYVGRKDYNLTTDLADEAIKHMRDLKAAAPDKPFFLYYVPGGTHSPHQPKEEWIEKFKGKFDMGYEKLRDQIFANQKRLGVIPANAQLTPWPDSIPRWDSLSALQKKLYARQAEVFAGYAAYTDYEIGRVIQEVQDEGQLDNTLIIYICGDNGTSPEGTLSGSFNQLTAYNGILKAPEALQMLHYNDWGSDKTYPHMSVGWSWAFDTPFKWTKQVASHFGGTRQGLAISWPGHISDPGGIRTQFHHVIDIVPTILEAAGVPAPTTVNGIPQKPIEGVSMNYTFDKANANAPSTRTTQYFEMAANRAIYHDGWIAATTPFAPPWELATGKLPDVTTGYAWELYNINEDYSENNNLAAKFPDKLKEMQALFQTEAMKYNVFPLDNTAFSRLLTARPSAVAGRTLFTYTGENIGIPLANAPSILDKDYTITADIDIPEGGAQGMIATLGGRFGGYGLFLSQSNDWWLRSTAMKIIIWSIFILGLLLFLFTRNKRWTGWKLSFKYLAYLMILFAPLWLIAGLFTGLFSFGRGRPVFVYNLLDLERFRWSGPSLGAGKHTISFDFKYDGPGPGKSGTGILSVDGKEVDKKTIPHSIPLMMSIDETFDIGADTRSAVDFSYDLPFHFTGTIDKLTYKLGPEQLEAPDKEKMKAAIASASD